MKIRTRAVFWAVPLALIGTACGALAGLEDHELAPANGGGSGGAGGASGGAGGESDAGGGGEGGEAGPQIQTLVEDLGRPHSIVVDGGEIFWATELANQRGIWRADIDGSSFDQLHTLENPTINNPSNVFIGLAADADYLHWTMNMDCEDPNGGVPWDGVERSARDGKMREPMWQECTRRPRAVVADDTYVFHTERWEIRRIQKDNLDWRLLAWDQNNAIDIAERGARVYWLAEFPNRTCVVTIDKDPPDQNLYEYLYCSPDQDNERRPKALAVDDGYAYWVDNGEVHRVITTAGEQATSELLASPGGVLVAIAIDETHVYFTSSSSGSVLRTLKLGGPVEDVALGQDGPRGIALDATAVYWTNYIGGQIRRVDKP